MTDNTIGWSIYMDDDHPATNDAAGFEDLTWVNISGLVQGPQFGITHNIIEIPDLLTGFTDVVKGAGTGIDTQMLFRAVASDTGQANAKTAAESEDGVASLKIVIDGSGTAGAPAAGDSVIYAQGILHSYQPNQPTVDAYEGFSVSFRQKKIAVYSTEPA